MDKDKWLREARRWAKHAYCYEGMPDEFPEHFDQAFAEGAEPYGAVDGFAEAYDLDRADSMATWGVNAGVAFVREDYH